MKKSTPDNGEHETSNKKHKKIKKNNKNETKNDDPNSNRRASREEIFAQNRSCRDSWCLLIYLAAIGGCVFLAYIAYIRDADPRKIISGYDKFGNTCGKKNKPIADAPRSGQDLRNMKYHYSEEGFDLCVRKCPNISLDTIEILKTLFDQDIQMCHYQIEKDNYSFDGGNLCAKKFSQATSTFIFDCTSTDGIKSNQAGLVSSIGTKLIEDLYTLNRVISTLVGIAIPLSFVWLILLRYMASFCVYTILLGVSTACTGGTVFMWLSYTGKIKIKEAVNQKELWLAGSIVATIFASFLNLIILSMLKRVRIAVAMFGETSKVMSRIPMLSCLPFFTVIYFLMAAGALTLLTVALLSPTEVEIKNGGNDVKFHRTDLRYFSIATVFMIFWIYQLSHDSTEFIIASTVAQWYFTIDKSKLSSPILTAVYYLLRYNYGSVAFGSLLIAILKFLRAIMYYITTKLDEYKLGFLTCMLNCVQCCLACFEKTLKFLTRNAYIEMAISGNGFLYSAKKSFKFMVNNALNLATINAITFILIWFSKILLSGAIGAAAFYWQKQKFPETAYNYNFSAAIYSGLGTFFIAHIFLEVYDMTIDTIFYCYSKDKEMSKGEDKKYYMSKDLAKLVKSKKVIIKRKLSDENVEAGER